MAKERNLTNITSVAAADFLRIVTSAGASVKATAANFAKYVIESYNGSTIAGSAQTVKDALDLLNSKSTSVALTIGSVSSNATVRKRAEVCVLPVSIGNGTALSSFTSGMIIGELPAGFRPVSSIYAVVLGRTTGVWASADYTPITVNVTTDGSIKIYGKDSDIKVCQYINGQIIFTTA